MSDLEHCLAILKALRISEVRYCLSGGGDSGTTELEDVLYCDGRHGPLPSVTIGITDAGGIVCLDECLDGIVADIPDGDWCNNEGGYGHVTLYPQESDEDLRVECDMTYGEDEAAIRISRTTKNSSPPISRTPIPKIPATPSPSTTAPCSPRKETSHDHHRLDYRNRQTLLASRRPRQTSAANGAAFCAPGARRPVNHH